MQGLPSLFCVLRCVGLFRPLFVRMTSCCRCLDQLLSQLKRKTANMNNSGPQSPFISMNNPTTNIQSQPIGFMMGETTTAPAQTEMSPLELQMNQERLHALVADLLVQEKREAALAELSKKRDTFPQLASTLWHSTGVMAALLQV
jgi:hypothetical protein